MKQYNSIKTKYPDALLLFRVGDFYETFGEDAIKAAQILGITLTRRANGSASFIELAGFPYHAVDTYLPKLVRAGQRVAICEQLEDPKQVKGIVKRGITELVTPGVSYNDKVLEIKENNFLAAVHLGDKQSGIAFLDISTGEFYIAQGINAYIDKLLQSLRPREVLVQKNKLRKFAETFEDNYYTNTFEDWVFTEDFAKDVLLRHFETVSFKGFGVEDIPLGIIAAGVAMHYLSETQHSQIGHICSLSRIEEDRYVWLDKFTIRNLELLSSPNEYATTLFEIIDSTVSPMGSRMLKRWLLLPLKDIHLIEERHQAVSFFMDKQEFSDTLRQKVKTIGDLERLISKVAVGRANPRELVQLKRALLAIDDIKKLCGDTQSESLRKIEDRLSPCVNIVEKLEIQLQEDPPVAVNKGQVFKAGVSSELDQLRDLAYSGKDYLLKLQQREIEETGISSLKVGFNNVFGYYLEVTHTHKDKVPEGWLRKQTLTNAERYITEELKEYEEKILGAEGKIAQIEQRLYENLMSDLVDYIAPIQHNAQLLAELDCLLSFALTAQENHYVRPEMDNESTEIDIINGRHPVIEKQLPLGESYIANDIFLNGDRQQIMIITGPNMSGKSALLRQTALIVLLAQIGSFVPADAARLGIVDKIFTRVGASDNISSGESTFMVEMNETASILNNLSHRSLILLDEIGRGTSTYDGISIAWAIAKYIHNHPKRYRPKVLFATHYHELIEMSDSFERIHNFHVSVKEVGRKVIFLRKLVAGGSEHSFGIHVARMAGMPAEVLKQASKMLEELEALHRGDGQSKKVTKSKTPGNAASHPPEGYQLSFIQLEDPLLLQIKEDILDTDINVLTPVEALLKLNEIKKIIEKVK